MSREVRWVLITALLVVLLGGTVIVLLRAPEPGGNDASLTFHDSVFSDVAQVSIQNAYGTMQVTREGEGYMADDIPADLVDLDDFVDLLTDCAQVRALRQVAKATKDLSVYGLDEPSARVSVTYLDGTSLTLRVGAQEPVSGDVYLQVDDNPGVYVFAAENVDEFLLPKRAFVEDQVTPELALSSPLSALLNVTLAGGSLAEPVTIEAVASGDPDVVRAAISFGAPTHIVRGKGTYELDQTYGVEMLGALLGITADEVVAYGQSAADLAAFGFDQPTMQVSFDLKNGLDVETVHYDLSLLVKEGVCYLTRNGEGVIYAVPEPAFLHLEYDKLPVRWFLSPLLIDVRAVEVHTAGEQYLFELSGSTNADLRVTCNGESLDMERFRVLYGLLISAAHDGALLHDIAPQGEPLLQLTYYYLDEAKEPDVMTLYTGDTRRVYVEVNGVTELAMREMYLTRVQQALAILWTDEPIETNW